MNFYTGKCVMISLDYYKPHDKKKKHFSLPNKDIINSILNQISGYFKNKELRFLTGYGRGAQAALYSMTENPNFSKNMLLTELYITDNPNTKINIEMSKNLINKLRPDVRINIVNGNDPWYKNYTDETLEFAKKCNPKIIQHEKKNLCSMSCFQYGQMELYRRKIEELWKKELTNKYNWREAEEIMKH